MLAECIADSPELRPRNAPHAFKIDRRTRWAKRVEAIERELGAELGDTISSRDRVLVANAAAAVCRAEQLRAAIARGEEIDSDELVRVSNLVSRLLTSLSKRQHQTQKQSLAAYLSGRANA
jgi:hypothetical protein